MYRSDERRAHWIGLNHQNRIPSRWIFFDTEAVATKTPTGEVQSWRMGAAARWRTDLAHTDAIQVEKFNTPEALWRWVTDFCRPKTRTVIWAHNISYDIRISKCMDILPELGWHLDWCNMGMNVSTMTWRSERGTLVFADLYSWLPMRLEDIGDLVGVHKMNMPGPKARADSWKKYVARDVEVGTKAVKEIVAFIRSEDLGNWQPTGAGMAFATWRHKFLEHKVLVHDDEKALEAERKAMHTGRAEAWKHGRLLGDTWVECDMQQAYVRIAAATDLPTKIKFHNGAITHGQYQQLRRRFCVLGRVEVRTSVPCVPIYHYGRTIWPVGEFTTWLWDCEIDVALREAKSVNIRECYVYTRAPILASWAQWVLKTQERRDDEATPAVRKWIKHSGRTLIGRIALRTSQWAVWGANPEGEAGISYEVDAETGKTYRLMHAGDRTLREEARVEGHDSLPQVTGYIMAMCRVWLWEAMCVAGFDNIAHVDTDSLHVNVRGLEAIRNHYGPRFAELWQIKATHNTLTVYGPRNYRGVDVRKLSGIPKRATETSANNFVGESWSSLAGDMSRAENGTVTVTSREWKVKTSDPRRRNAGRGSKGTTPIVLGQNSNVCESSDSTSTVGS